MASLSISAAWDETKAVLARDGRLFASVALALTVLPAAIVGAFYPGGLSTAIFAVFESNSLGLTVLVVAVFLVILTGQLAITRLAIGPSITVGGAITHSARRLPSYVAVALIMSAAIMVVMLVGAAFIATTVKTPVSEEELAKAPAVAVVVLVMLAAYLFLMTRIVSVAAAVATTEGTGPLRIIRIVNGYRLAAVLFHNRKTGDIGRPVTDVDHVRKRDRPNIEIHVIIYVLRHIKEAFVYPEEKLRFLRVADHPLRKRDAPLLILRKFAAKNRSDKGSQPAAVNEHLYAGGDDVVLDRDALLGLFGCEKIFSEIIEHFRKALVEIQVGAESAQLIVRRPVHPEGVEQHLHVSQFAVIALIPDELGTASPKAFPIDPESRKNDLVLHVTRAQRLVVIIDDGNRVLRCGHFVSR